MVIPRLSESPIEPVSATAAENCDPAQRSDRLVSPPQHPGLVVGGLVAHPSRRLIDTADVVAPPAQKRLQRAGHDPAGPILERVRRRHADRPVQAAAGDHDPAHGVPEWIQLSVHGCHLEMAQYVGLCTTEARA